MRIMVVDDDEAVLRFLVAVLQGEGHAVDAYVNSEKALARLLLAAPSDVDLLISDVNMPGIDGFELATSAAQLLGIHPPRTLLISGALTCDDPRLDRTPASAILGFLPKPLTRQTLRDATRAILTTRTRCPGLHLITCEHASDATPLHPCTTAHYCSCPHFMETCGPRLRDWFSTLAEPAASSAPSQMPTFP